jgi:Domain of unkown function (DUF1775)
MRRLVIAAAAILALALAAAPAQAHVQVSPAEAAPGDPVLFQLLVPNEREASTVEVRMKVPANVIPFSYEEPAGWKRTVKLAPSGAPDEVRWRGRLAADGFARFAFLATTPARPGTLAWKTIQRYSDGTTSDWIGAPGTESPAAFTTVKAGVPRQNAGGEGRPTAAAALASMPVAAASGGDDTVALVLAATGALLGAAALLVALRRRS